MNDRKFQRIVVVGPSCAGKTTLARKLAQARGIAYIELDFVHKLGSE